MKEKLYVFDPLDFMRTEEEIQLFLKAAKEDGDRDHLLRVEELAEIARKRLADHGGVFDAADNPFDPKIHPEKFKYADEE